MQVHHVTDVAAFLSGVDKLAWEFDAELDVIRASAPFPVGSRRSTLAVIARARFDGSFGTSAGHWMSHCCRHERVDEGGFTASWFKKGTINANETDTNMDAYFIWSVETFLSAQTKKNKQKADKDWEIVDDLLKCEQTPSSKVCCSTASKWMVMSETRRIADYTRRYKTKRTVVTCLSLFFFIISFFFFCSVYIFWCIQYGPRWLHRSVMRQHNGSPPKLKRRFRANISFSSLHYLLFLFSFLGSLYVSNAGPAGGPSDGLPAFFK